MMISAVVTAAQATERIEFVSGENAASVIELFTSEGCSSCPPADAWMSQLKNSSDLWRNFVPAVFHVDYWDGLGWPDRFAKAEFTQRQRRYAASWPTGAVYTPAFVLNAREWRGFSNRESPPKVRGETVGVLTVALKNELEATATFVPQVSIPGPLKLEIALLGTNLQSDVKRGENSGHKLHHDFVVLQLVTTPMTNEGSRWTGTVSLSTKGLTDKPTALGAWIKPSEASAPLQATGGWLTAGPH